MHRAGYIAIFGKPNAGKSTLVNHFVGREVSIVTHKRNTTQTRILGVCHRPNAQFVFMDTPGVYQSRADSKTLHSETEAALMEADVWLWLMDASQLGSTENAHANNAYEAEAALFQRMVARIPDKPLVIALNKSDKVRDARMLAHLQGLSDTDIAPNAFVPVSAKSGKHCARLLEVLTPLLPENPAYFETDTDTVQSAEFAVQETVRKHLLLFMHQEIPYQSEVRVQSFAMNAERLWVRAEIVVASHRHKAMVLGKGGMRIKAIGKAVRSALETEYQCPADVRLHVQTQ